MRRGILSALLLITAVGSNAAAVSWEHDLRGYLKDYPSITRSGGETDWLNTTRARLKFRWMPTYRLTFSADYDVSASVGSLVENPVLRQSLSSATAHRELLDMSQVITSRDEIFARHTIDRLYAEYYSDRFVLTVGRQRVAWGVSDYFRPLDQFAPFAPAEIDKEERAGIDAAKVSIPLGQLSNVELIYSPRKDFDNERIGTRVRTNFGEWDVSGVVGRFEHGESVGGSFSGAVGGTGLTGELLAARDGYVATNLNGSTVTDTYVKATLGASYGFKWHNLTLSGEAYYDGSGKSSTSEYDWIGLLQGYRVSMARYYGAGTASLLLTPLVTLSGTVLANADDGSYLLQPQIEWNARQNLDLSLGAQMYEGSSQTEYGAQSNIIYAIVAFYF